MFEWDDDFKQHKHNMGEMNCYVNGMRCGSIVIMPQIKNVTAYVGPDVRWSLYASASMYDVNNIQVDYIVSTLKKFVEDAWVIAHGQAPEDSHAAL